MTTLYMLAVSLSAIAQSNVTVKSFAQTVDHIPGSDRRNDFNGVPCALIKVYVVDDIERVEGNKIGDVVKKGNVEKWVYMCKGSRNIRIHFKNHLPVRVVFQDYDMKDGLESNRVYELMLQISESANARNPIENVSTIEQADNYPSINASECQPIEKAKRALNYRFDYSEMTIDGVNPQEFILRDGRRNKYNHFETYQEFKDELENVFIRSANEELRNHEGYLLTNSGNYEHEVIVGLIEMDEDGEHDIRVVVRNKQSNIEISSFTVHVGSGSNNFFKGFNKQIEKSGKRFGLRLTDIVLKKMRLDQGSESQ